MVSVTLIEDSAVRRLKARNCALAILLLFGPLCFGIAAITWAWFPSPDGITELFLVLLPPLAAGGFLDVPAPLSGVELLETPFRLPAPLDRTLSTVVELLVFFLGTTGSSGIEMRGDELWGVQLQSPCRAGLWAGLVER